MYIFDPVCGALHDRTKSSCRRSRAETTLVCAEVVARIITALESVFHRDKFAANARDHLVAHGGPASRHAFFTNGVSFCRAGEKTRWALVPAYGVALIRFLAARVTDLISLFTWKVGETSFNALVEPRHV